MNSTTKKVTVKVEIVTLFLGCFYTQQQPQLCYECTSCTCGPCLWWGQKAAEDFPSGMRHHSSWCQWRTTNIKAWRQVHRVWANDIQTLAGFAKHWPSIVFLKGHIAQQVHDILDRCFAVLGKQSFKQFRVKLLSPLNGKNYYLIVQQ